MVKISINFFYPIYNFLFMDMSKFNSNSVLKLSIVLLSDLISIQSPSKNPET